MTQANHQIARKFFAALSSGNMPDELLTDDMTAWTTTTPAPAEKAWYQGGVKLLGSIFDGGCTYTVDSLTAEDDRVAAEVHADGTLVNGEKFHNVYVFMLRIRDGRIASVAEHFDPNPVVEKLVPLLMAAMGKAG